MAKLKIQHTRTGGAGYEAGATIVVDSYANNQKLDSAGTASSSGNYEGGVGGFTTQTIPTIQPTVKVRGETATSGSILAQKGAHKFLVSDENTVQDESIVAGQEYRISSVSGTDWSQFGAGSNANTNDIFTATINGSAATVDDGTVQNVSTCTLVNLTTPTDANTMSILCTAATFTDGTIANIGAGTISGYTNRTAAYLTWTTGAGSLFKVGQTVNFTNSNVSGSFTVGEINTTTNLTIVTSTDQTFASNASAGTVTFLASKISNKYVWDFLSDGEPHSSSGGGFTGANNPNRYRYWFSSPSDVFVQVANA
jgi:hypothetical protein